MVRTPAQDHEPASVTVERLAFGISALECPIYGDPLLRWSNFTPREQAGYRARARFALGLAEDVHELDLGGQLRWRADVSGVEVTLSPTEVGVPHQPETDDRRPMVR